jgi:glutamate N-acetyltransferase/amino-acid N-acetyltransferase
MQVNDILNGSLTTPLGFQGGAVSAGLKPENQLDLAILFAASGSIGAGVFTKNKILAPPVLITKEHLATSNPRAIVVNSAIANSVVGDKGLEDARTMATITADVLNINPGEVLVCSTGVIGVPLPMDLIKDGINKVKLIENDHGFSKAIMTTDTRPKEFAVSIDMNGEKITVAGAAKGSGMIHPDMATMLAFLTTDARIASETLSRILSKAVDMSFNMVTIDGDSSTNDSVLMIASGQVGSELILNGQQEEDLQSAVNNLCIRLAKEIARDGEGATKLIEVRIEGANNLDEARLAARTIAASTLMKAAVFGNDPNWGRAIAALGRSGADFTENKLSLSINHIEMLKNGAPVPFVKDEAVKSMESTECEIYIHLGIGDESATAWTCDLTEEYVHINSAYTT